MNLILSLVGLIAVANFTLRRTDRVSMYAASFLASLVFAAGPWLFSPLNWDRYHFMPVCLSTILIAVGVAETLRQFARRFRQ